MQFELREPKCDTRNYQKKSISPEVEEINSFVWGVDLYLDCFGGGFRGGMGITRGRGLYSGREVCIAVTWSAQIGGLGTVRQGRCKPFILWCASEEAGEDGGWLAERLYHTFIASYTPLTTFMKYKMNTWLKIWSQKRKPRGNSEGTVEKGFLN